MYVIVLMHDETPTLTVTPALSKVCVFCGCSQGVTAYVKTYVYISFVRHTTPTLSVTEETGISQNARLAHTHDHSCTVEGVCVLWVQPRCDCLCKNMRLYFICATYDTHTISHSSATEETGIGQNTHPAN